MIPSYSIVGEESAARLCFLTHGALGAAHNLRAFARRIVTKRPDFKIALVDLRLHGKSPPADPPHNIAACVQDFENLAHEIGPPEIMIGHSLGGKVALAYGKAYAERQGASPSDVPLRQVWALDSDPGKQVALESHEVLTVLKAASSLRPPFPSRAYVVETLLAAGLSSGIANWLSTNVERSGDTFTWRFDEHALRELLSDYFSLDLWPFLETLSERRPHTPEFHLVVAEHSDRWSGTMRARAEELAPSSAHLRLHHLPKSGHWVHVDNPEGLLDILIQNWPE